MLKQAVQVGCAAVFGYGLFKTIETLGKRGTQLKHRVYARVGLLGNPSDGFNGRTISLSLENYYAEVTLTPARKVELIPNPECDPSQFDSLASFAERIKVHGYYGGVRLLQATLLRFYEVCSEQRIELPHRPFTLSYTTNIPKSAGLSGSSAIIYAGLKCLIEHHGITGRFRKVELPNIVLSVESALGITAGLQDRVIQVYEGVVYMDFAKKIMDTSGHGQYIEMDPSLLPDLYLLYCENPCDSGKMHNDVKQRWLKGDKEVIAGMKELADNTREAKKALEDHNHKAFADFIDRNFALRRKMFGDPALGALNIRMVEIATEVGAAAKFTGSGGASVVYCRGGEKQVAALRAACDKEGFVLEKIRVHRPGQ
eukprot:CAMPEP_0197844330 /NCGR_PEP_ID=MMETSP1438-20131217/1313_1 /TAXON_ID=1461541 /ORGANISM="Pterosperma sp., Strain CCMP1384" /LENGTH=369 /DNA_ID=CAMNT_0043455057 /DNA_START=85 /DNA_END=1194 /DNA_ORIENTATION=+